MKPGYLHDVLWPGCIIRVFDDIAGPWPIPSVVPDPFNWSDELVTHVENHVIHTRQVAACLDGEMLARECLFQQPNLITTFLEPAHFYVLPVRPSRFALNP